jgi:hypothetical protein
MTFPSDVTNNQLVIVKTKKCIRCGNDKELEEFYAHPKMRDGHLNKCKKCCKEVADIREKALRKDSEDWCEKERIRSKEKYYRLGYKEQQVENNKLKSYKNAKYVNLHRDLKLLPNENPHHWNYALLEDVIILDKKFHRFIHRYLILNEDTLTFTTKDNEVLDSKEMHLQFIEKIKAIYNNN